MYPRAKVQRKCHTTKFSVKNRHSRPVSTISENALRFSRRSLKDRLYFLHLTSYFFCDSPNRIKFSTLALTDIRDEPREAVEELGSDGREGTGPQEAGRYRLAEDV